MYSIRILHISPLLSRWVAAYSVSVPEHSLYTTLSQPRPPSPPPLNPTPIPLFTQGTFASCTLLVVPLVRRIDPPQQFVHSFFGGCAPRWMSRLRRRRSSSFCICFFRGRARRCPRPAFSAPALLMVVRALLVDLRRPSAFSEPALLTFVRALPHDLGRPQGGGACPLPAR